MQAETPKDNEQQKTPQGCQNCGGTAFESGELAMPFGNPHINFYADQQGFLQSAPRVRARRCTSCGHLSLFANI